MSIYMALPHQVALTSVILVMTASACAGSISQSPLEKGDSVASDTAEDVATIDSASDTGDTTTDTTTGETSTTDTGEETSETTEPVSYPDLASRGPFNVAKSDDWVTPSGSVPTQYYTFKPAGAPAAPHVILTHGFSRNQGVLAELAEHYASWGLEVITMNLRHSYILDNDPELDAEELIWLSDEVGGGPVIYIGHSAGAMRSVVAGANDPDTVAVFGLDLVDLADAAWGNSYLALENAPDVPGPIWGLAAESSDCNSSANGTATYAAAADGNLMRVTDADHCDFEAPTDFTCTLFCEGGNSNFSNDEISATIRAASTAFLLWQAGLEPLGEDWWTPGEQPYEELLSSGAVSQL